MTTRSLAFRLFVAAAAWVVVVLVVAGVVLSSVYQHATERSFDERLHVYLKTLVADIAGADVGDRTAPGAMGEPRFELPLSGWYWQINRLDKPASNGSKSLFEATLPSLDDQNTPGEPSGVREGYIKGPDDRRLRAVERLIDLGEDGRYRVTLAGPADEIDSAISDFQYSLLLTFTALGVGLLAAILLQVRFGLRPLSRISGALARMRTGEAAKLPPDLPDEIVPLARELDALVDANREVVERARTHVGNLAHALKTPLSVIANEAGTAPVSPLAEQVGRQVGVMRKQIDHHLQRARIAAAVSVVGTVTEIAPVIEGLVRAMEKIHAVKRLKIKVQVDPALRFRGEKQDIEEMTGNLIDNACKWAISEVMIRAEAFHLDGAMFARITIDDDGPGLSPEKRAEAGQRGKRLDETKPGTGLGLAIVQDLVSLYGGRFNLDEAPIGGLRAVLDIPALQGPVPTAGARPSSRSGEGATV
ncbi:ATP-binding protein [Labrys sedimenti]|uniref:ATP-binding protein n=1 Tax=Labrys sedimenti TaxID=3106036 RepID=UPI002ACAFEE4|nr:ATP-binding protein [Labrys sp. ZIDIC5]MDZ5449972.1 ATP-binding protein [Labrys sp. ZIDIC5]